MATVAPTSDSTLRPMPPALASDAARADGAMTEPPGGGVQTADSVTDLATRGQAGLEQAILGAMDGELDEDSIPAHVLPLPVTVAVAVPVRNFRVRNLLGMRVGTVLETQWGHGEDLPLASGDVALAWAEFEVSDTQLGVRVTRLA